MTNNPIKQGPCPRTPDILFWYGTGVQKLLNRGLHRFVIHEIGEMDDSAVEAQLPKG